MRGPANCHVQTQGILQRWALQDAARAYLVAIALKVVVKGELHSSRDVLERIQADGQLAAHHPLLRLAVGIAGVVYEPPERSLHTCCTSYQPLQRLRELALSPAPCQSFCRVQE